MTYALTIPPPQRPFLPDLLKDDHLLFHQAIDEIAGLAGQDRFGAPCGLGRGSPRLACQHGGHILSDCLRGDEQSRVDDQSAGVPSQPRPARSFDEPL